MPNDFCFSYICIYKQIFNLLHIFQWPYKMFISYIHPKGEDWRKYYFVYTHRGLKQWLQNFYKQKAPFTQSNVQIHYNSNSVVQTSSQSYLHGLQNNNKWISISLKIRSLCTTYSEANSIYWTTEQWSDLLWLHTCSFFLYNENRQWWCNVANKIEIN